MSAADRPLRQFADEAGDDLVVAAKDDIALVGSGQQRPLRRLVT
jgi:hypothetical protein